MSESLDRSTASVTGGSACSVMPTSSSTTSSASTTPNILIQNQVHTIVLYGVPIVSLLIDGKERLCLAQISNTLLKDFSYNEIHNRRVALGITCVQCTPVQLEILRRAGAMPISSRRCGMITKREAERLVKSFLEDSRPPRLPDDFSFNVFHKCGWGCNGAFSPSRYNSSRAKCVKCDLCGMFFSPNKFIFHYHRTPTSEYQHPDAANFNSWRRHLQLKKPVPEEIESAWEEVKAMFNGGGRKRISQTVSVNEKHSPTRRTSPSVGRATDTDDGKGMHVVPKHESLFSLASSYGSPTSHLARRPYLDQLQLSAAAASMLSMSYLARPRHLLNYWGNYPCRYYTQAHPAIEYNSGTAVMPLASQISRPIRSKCSFMIQDVIGEACQSSVKITENCDADEMCSGAPKRKLADTEHDIKDPISVKKIKKEKIESNKEEETTNGHTKANEANLETEKPTNCCEPVKTTESK